MSGPKSNQLHTLDQMSSTFIGRLKNSVEREGPIKYPKSLTQPSTPAKYPMMKVENEE